MNDEKSESATASTEIVERIFDASLFSGDSKFEKEGIQSAIDFVKYILTLSGGAIAFLIQPTFLQNSIPIKILSSFSFVLLIVCIFSGLLVHARGCVMLSKREYDLEDPHLKYAGLVNQFSFALGFLFLGWALVYRVWG